MIEGKSMNAPCGGVCSATETGRRHEKPTLLMGIGPGANVGLAVGELTAAGEVERAGEALVA